MGIRITCSSCQETYTVDDSLRGKKVRCRECQEPIVVQAARPRPARDDDEEVEDRARPERRVATGPSRGASPRRRDEEVEEAPRRRPARSRDDEEVEEAPRRQAIRSRDDDEAPRRRSSRDRRDEEEEDRPRKSVKKQGGGLLPVVLIGGAAALLMVGLGIGGIVWALSGNKKTDPGPQTLNRPGPNDPGSQQPKDQGALPAEMPKDVLARVKQSSVYLRVDLPNGGVAQGTGWFAVEPGIIITNAHVLGMLDKDSQLPNSVAVWVNHGEPNEFKLDGLVQGVDRTNDLAVLRVDPAGGKPLPPPLQIDSSGKLIETQKVYIFGFPFGVQLGKNITVSESSISSLRLDESAQLHQIQVNGGMHPGNSGGPVTDTRGRVIGVSVAIIRGTSINFAIPTRYVEQVLAGRFNDSEFGVPYTSGSGVNLPVRVTALDPLNRIKEVKLEVWAGNPGRPRPATFTQPPAAPGDGARQSVPASGRDGTYDTDVPLPRLAPGQVCWVQPVLVNAVGVRQWGQAVSYTFDPASVLERTAMLLEFKPPSSPIERTLTMSCQSAWTLFSGNNQLTSRRKMEGHVLEVLHPDSRGLGTGIRLTLGRPQMTRERRNKKVEALPADIYAYLAQFSPTFLVDVRNTAKERGNRSFKAVPPQHRETVEDLFGLVCNIWEMTTVPLPNRMVRPQESWPARIPMLVDDEDTKDIVDLHVKCTFEGVRTVNGRKLAYIRLSGVAKGRERIDVVYGKVSGHALLDVAKGFLTHVQTHISTEADTGNSGVRILMTSESVVTRVEGNTQGIRPATTTEPVVKPPPPPPTPIRGDLAVLFERERVAGKEFTMTAYVRNPAPNTIITLSLPPGLQLVSGTARTRVPPVPAGVAGPYSLVTWRIRPLRSGTFNVRVSLNNKVAPVEGPVTVQPAGARPGPPKKR